MDDTVAGKTIGEGAGDNSSCSSSNNTSTQKVRYSTSYDKLAVLGCRCCVFGRTLSIFVTRLLVFCTILPSKTSLDPRGKGRRTFT